MNITAAMEDALEVTVHQRIDSEGQVFHYGEMIKKPDACRRPVSENNDKRHRLKQAELEIMDMTGFTQLFQRPIPPARSSEENDQTSEPQMASTSAGQADTRRPWMARYTKDDNLLTLDQEQIAADLARDGLTGKEQRVLFQKMKAMPLDQQQSILERSKVLKSTVEGEKERIL